MTHTTVRVQGRTMERLARLRDLYESRGELEVPTCPWTARHASWSAVILRAIEREVERLAADDVRRRNVNR